LHRLIRGRLLAGSGFKAIDGIHAAHLHRRKKSLGYRAVLVNDRWPDFVIPSMNAPIFLLLALVLLLMTFGRVIFRMGSKGTDWALEVAFIRLEFPPEHRDVAQQIAAGLAEIVGMKIKQLKPEHNLSQIAEWAENQIDARDLITLFLVAFDVKCDPNTTFATVVRKVAERKGSREVLTQGA
jgi:hypothetical protein